MLSTVTKDISQSKLNKRNVWCLLGLPFDVVDFSIAIEAMGSFIDTKQHCFLTTPNLNFLIAAQSDQQFFQSVVDSDLVVADGMPIIWVAKLLGVPLTERVAGSTLFDTLSNQKNRTNKIKVFFFGGQAGVAEQAHQRLNETSSAMKCCGYYDPGFVTVEEMSSPEIIDTINEADPDFLVVALGAKKGQQWIQKNRDKLNARVMSHLGAVINFVAGNVQRAPESWQRWGLEWVWRIKQEPELWRRYFFDGLAFVKLIVFKVFPLFFYDRWLKHSGAFKVPVSVSQNRRDKCVIELSGGLSYRQLALVKRGFDDVLQIGQGDVILNFSALVYIDAAFIGSLILFQRYLNAQHRQLFLQNVPKRISLLLDLNNVLDHFQLKVD